MRGTIVSSDVVKERTFPTSSVGTIFVKIALLIGPDTALKQEILAPVIT